MIHYEPDLLKHIPPPVIRPPLMPAGLPSEYYYNVIIDIYTASGKKVTP